MRGCGLCPLSRRYGATVFVFCIILVRAFSFMIYLLPDWGNRSFQICGAVKEQFAFDQATPLFIGGHRHGLFLKFPPCSPTVVHMAFVPLALPTRFAHVMCTSKSGQVQCGAHVSSVGKPFVAPWFVGIPFATRPCL